MTMRLLIAGGGIGGLAAAQACARQGREIEVHEQAPAFEEVGAGIQLGPNATRVLIDWGLEAAVRRVAAQPRRVVLRSASDGRELGALDLGAEFLQRYGAPYLTIHRADLQQLLLEAARSAGVALHTASRIREVSLHGECVHALAGSAPVRADAVIAADGIWSELRDLVAGEERPRFTGHVAYRSITQQSLLPASCRTNAVTVWLGERMHVVVYPLRGGEWLNLVALVEGRPPADMRSWDHLGIATELRTALGPITPALAEHIDAMPAWRVWALNGRAPVAGAHQMARGRIALLGDAAHPMLPYLAQGAGMAIEDADVLTRLLHDASTDQIPEALRRYAQLRWARVARVQRGALRNAVIFHASGLVRWGRDAAMRVLGERLLDQPWLYARRTGAGTLSP